MALTDESGFNVSMPVAPAYGAHGMPFMGGQNNGGGLFGNGDSWLGILFLIALCNGGFGGFGGFGGGMLPMMMMSGMGGFGMDMLYPWLNNSQNINSGFRDQQLSTQLSGIQSAVTSGFGDVQLGIAGVNQNICQTGNGIMNAVNQGFASTNLGMCNGFNGVNNSIFGAQTAISQQMNANEIANLNRSFAEQTANTAGFSNVTSQLAQNGYNQAAGTADLKYTIATENCADRAALSDGIRDILAATQAQTQTVMDKLCALELDGVKNQLAQAQRENVGLQNQLNMATLAASQTAQTSDIINGTYTRLSQCPVNSTPVYGNQPIFTCPNNNNSCGCGNGTF